MLFLSSAKAPLRGCFFYFQHNIRIFNMTAFMNRWRMPFLKAESMLQKASSAAPMASYHMIGQPIWTPQNYTHLTEEGYTRNAIVYRCVNLIARGVSGVPLLLYKHAKGKRHEVENHPFLNLLQCPSPRQAGSAFIEAVVGYLLLSGNTYLEAVSGMDGPCELYTLRPDRMRIVPGKHGTPQAYEYTVGGQKKVIPVNESTGQSSILHLKTFNPLNDWYGMSAIEAASRSIDQHNAVGGHNLALLQNGGRPSGALLVKPGPYGQTLTQEQRQSLRSDLRKLYEGGHNAGKIMVLEGDCDWKEMGLSPKDLDFIEGKNVSAREIAQAFGVPPMLVGVPGDATFANYKEARFHLWEDTILPLVEFLVTELNLWLSPYFGHNLRLGYDLDSIPALAPRREATWAKIMSANFLTINEKREALGYTPLSNGDTLAV
jgi:HK97 family phage portal protein